MTVYHIPKVVKIKNNLYLKDEIIEICIILCARLDQLRNSGTFMRISVCGSMCARGVSKTKEWKVWKKVLRRVQVCIDEYL